MKTSIFKNSVHGLALAAVALMISLPAHAAGDPAKGAQLFDDNCSDCHTIAQGGSNKRGPNLVGVVGRKTGSVADYEYSDANKAAGWVWTPEVLDRYLADPKQALPGTKMKFKGDADAQERADIIAFLQTLHK
jgi:cytochrome c